MQNKWAVVGGILSIVSGAFGILSGLVLVFVGIFFREIILLGDISAASDLSLEEISTIITVMYGATGMGFVLLGVLALIGGIFAIRRKLWGLALAGAIAAVLIFFPTGVVAIIFTSMARPEFLNTGTSMPGNPGTSMQT